MALPVFPERFNMAHWFLDARIEEGNGDRPAILTADRTLTYRDVQALANRVANVLVSAGLEVEQRVLIVLPDSPEFAGAFFGTLKAGGVVAMANPLLPTEDYDYLLEYTRARVLITHASVRERIGPSISRARFLAKTLLAGEPGWEEVEKAKSTFTNADTHRDDQACWLFTSGTTGKPKAAMHRHADFPFNTEVYAKGVLGYRESDVTIAVSKLFFGYATGTNLMFPFAVGARTALFEERSTPEAILQAIKRHKPTILAAVPTTLNGMLTSPEAEGADLSSIRFAISAGEALPPELFRKFKERFGVEILDGIGSAEMFHIYVTNYPGQARAGTLGKVVPGYSIEILGDDGKPVAPGEVGTMWVKGETAALGYWLDRSKSVATFAGERCNTNDKFRVDEEGFLWYAGRGDDLLKVGGIFVSPLEVEDCLLQHRDVRECAIIGYEEDGLTKAMAYVVAAPGAAPGDTLAESIREHARAKMARYKVPRKIVFVAELPRSDRGKLQRKLLRESPPKALTTSA
jgi:benzoate-CoA ligase family protein